MEWNLITHRQLRLRRYHIREYNHCCLPTYLLVFLLPASEALNPSERSQHPAPSLHVASVHVFNLNVTLWVPLNASTVWLNSRSFFNKQLLAQSTEQAAWRGNYNKWGQIIDIKNTTRLITRVDMYVLWLGCWYIFILYCILLTANAMLLVIYIFLCLLLCHNKILQYKLSQELLSWCRPSMCSIFIISFKYASMTSRSLTSSPHLVLLLILRLSFHFLTSESEMTHPD